MAAKKVVICDDHELVRRALRDRLEATDGFEVVAEVGDCPSLLDAVEESRPEVVLIDIELPGSEDGLNAAVEIGGTSPRTKILMITAHDDTEVVGAAREAGALGFIPKSAAASQVVEAIEAVLGGNEWFPDGQDENGDLRRLMSLSAREREILDLIASGLKAGQVAERLTIEKATVYTHVRNAVAKLGVRTRSEAIALVTRYRYLTPRRRSS